MRSSLLFACFLASLLRSLYAPEVSVAFATRLCVHSHLNGYGVSIGHKLIESTISKNTKNMLVADLADLYKNTTDADLRYMALREHVLAVRTPTDEKNTQELMSRVLIPALHDETSAVRELVSTQVIPHVARVNPELAEEYVVVPLCVELQRCAIGNTSANATDAPHTLQALQNVVRQTQWHYNSSEALDNYVGYLSGARERPYIAWESLALLLESAPANHVTAQTYHSLYALALEDKRAATFRPLQIATSKVSPDIVKSAFLKHELTEPHCALLAHTTKEKYAFKDCYEDLITFVLRNLPKPDQYSDLYEILINLLVWMEQPKMGPTCQLKLQLWNRTIALCDNVLVQSQAEAQSDSDDIDSENDAYLAELSDNEDEVLEFDDDEETSQLDYVLKLLVLTAYDIPLETQKLMMKTDLKMESLLELVRSKNIGYDVLVEQFSDAVDSSLIAEMPLEFVQKLPNTPLIINRIESLTGESQLPSDVNFENVKDIVLGIPQLFNNTQKDIVYFIQNNLSIETDDLLRLQEAVELASLACKREEFLAAHDNLALSLLPHLKPNKAFIKTIKVGNMKQNIDDGVTLRLNCYALLQQLNISYGVKCLLLQECIERGLKDEALVKESAVSLLLETLHNAWTELRIRDNIWLRETLLPRLIERIDKFYGSPLQASATSQQIAERERSIRCMDRLKLSVDQYITVTTDEPDVPL